MPPTMEPPEVNMAIGVPRNEGETLKVVIPTEVEGTPLFEAILMMP